MSASANHDSACDAPSAHEILSSMLEEVGDLSSLLELFYLSREPGALELLRWFVALPEPGRAEFIAFLGAATEKGRPEVKRSGKGTLSLTA